MGGGMGNGGGMGSGMGYGNGYGNGGGMGSGMGNGMGYGNGGGMGNGMGYGMGGGMNNGMGGGYGMGNCMDNGGGDCCPMKRISGSMNPQMDGVYEKKNAYDGVQYCFADSLYSQSECEAVVEEGENPVDIGSGSASCSGSGSNVVTCQPKTLMDNCNINCVGNKPVSSPLGLPDQFTSIENGINNFVTTWTILAGGLIGNTFNLQCPNASPALDATSFCENGEWSVPPAISAVCGFGSGSGSGSGSASGSSSDSSMGGMDHGGMADHGSSGSGSDSSMGGMDHGGMADHG